MSATDRSGVRTSSLWPATSTELVDRHRKGSRLTDYHAAVVPAIANRTLPPLPWRDIEEATAALVRADTRTHDRARTPLLLAEAIASSRIEHIHAPALEVAAAYAGREMGRSPALIAANARAITHLHREPAPGDIIAAQATLLGDSAPHLTGGWRKQAVWIGGMRPQDAVYVAPRYERVPKAMRDLDEFRKRYDMPVLAHAAIVHAHFETIHPFPDGNGRTGRALAHSVLADAGTTERIVAPISSALAADTRRYVTALQAYRAGDVLPIVHAFMDAAFVADNEVRRLDGRLAGVHEEYSAAAPGRAGSAAKRTVDVLFDVPVIDSRLLAHELGVTVRNAQLAIDSLADAGILHVVDEDARRDRLWAATAVLEAIDGFGFRRFR